MERRRAASSRGMIWAKVRASSVRFSKGMLRRGVAWGKAGTQRDYSSSVPGVCLL